MENSRIPGEHFFTTSDNTALFYRHWPALQPGAKKVIVLFHRGHEHSGRLQHIVDELAMPDTAFYAWDARDNIAPVKSGVIIIDGTSPAVDINADSMIFSPNISIAIVIAETPVLFPIRHCSIYRTPS